MNINIATIVNGTEKPVGIGVNQSQKCIIKTEDGALLKAYLKRGDIDEIKTEMFCSILLSGWGLNVPTPYLVLEDDFISFASADVAYPNISQRFNLESITNKQAKDIATKLACKLVASFKSTPLAIAVDELIDNRDRNLQNILWDGSIESWIDHGASLGNGERKEFDNINKLCIITRTAGTEEKALKSALVQSLVLTESVIIEASATLNSHINVEDAKIFLLKRLPKIRQLIANRFNKNDLFGMK